MQSRVSYPGIKGERTSWRDGHLSERHRKWGFGVPAQDIDFLLLELDRSKPTALIEYKSEFAGEQYPSHPSYLTLINLGDRADLPVFVVRYAQNFSWWKVIPLNSVAKKMLPERVEVNERLYVTWLYNLRNLTPPEEIFKGLEVAF